MKKLLAFLLAAALMLGVLAPGLGSLSAFAVGAAKLPSVTSGDLTFIVPETIYLAPDARSWSVATASPFQFYVNNTQSGGTTANAAETTGKIYYALSGGSSATLSWQFLDTSLNAISGGSVTVSGSTVSNGGSVTVTGGSSPSLAASANGCFLRWTLSFTENSIAKKAYAYTYVYKPYVIPIAAAALAGTGTSSGANWAGTLTWLSGMHGINEGGMPDYSYSSSLDSYEENNYLKFTEFACFTSSASTAYVGGTAVNVAAQGVAASSWAGHDTSKAGDRRYVVFANTSGTPKSYAYMLFENNREPTSYNNGSSDTSQNWGVRNTTFAKYRGNNKDVVTKAVAKSIGTITIDTSRYTNLNQIPNLSVGLAVTTDKACDDGTGRWWMADISQTAFAHRSTWYKTDESGLESTAMERDYIFAGQGNSWHTRSYDTNEGIRYAGAWNRTLLNTSGIEQMYYVKSLYGNAEKSAGSNYDANACGYVGLKATYVNKTALRTAVQRAIKKMPALGVNGISGSGMTSCYFDADVANYKWAAFQTAFNEASKGLARVETDSTTAQTLTNNLNNALDALQTYYTVDGNGGLLSNTQSSYTTVGTDQYGIGIINVRAERNGYLLQGWSVDPNAAPAQAEPANYVTVGYNSTVYAIWAPAVYDINYTLDGGSFEGSYPAHYTIEETVTLVTPARTGYRFTGWSGTGLTGDANMTVTIPVGSTGERNYTAHWEKEQYTITFDTDGGSVINPITAYYGDAITKPANPTKEGHYFMYWTRDGSVTYLPATMPAESYTVKANWLINRYTITFDTDGGSAIDPISDVYGTAVTPPDAPTKEGFVFAGWNPALPETIPGANMTVTAQWVNPTITFDTAGGSAVAPISQAYGTAITPPAPPTKQGCIFTGWSPALPDTMPGEDLTVTAQWTDPTITFDTAGGSAVAAITQAYGTALTPPAPPTKQGYTFAGWDPALPDAMPGENLTVTAQWTLAQYTITYDLDGGSDPGNPAGFTIESDAITLINPTKTGYTFTGWSGTGLTGNANMTVTIPACSIDSRSYTAHWQINSYTITFDTDGGSAVAPIILNYGDPVVLPADPEKTDCIFTGWDPALPDTMPAEDLYVTAVWEPVSIVARFHSLTLNGDIGVNFYVDVPNATADTYAIFSVDGEDRTVMIDLTKYVVKDGFKAYKFTCNVHAPQTDTPIVGKVVRGTLESDYFTYTVQDYLTEAQNAYPAGHKMIVLMSSLATYSFCANAALGYNPDFVQHPLYDDSGFAAITPASLASYAAQNTNTAAGVNYYGSSLVMKTETSIKHYFKLRSGQHLDDFTFLLGEGAAAVELTPVISGSYYCVEITDIASGKLDDPYKITVLDGNGNTVNTWIYSALSYSHTVLTKYAANDPNVSDALAAAAKALVLYSQAANAYFNV